MAKTFKKDKGDLAYIPEVKTFTTKQLMDALFDVEDVLSRSSCPFFLLDETARQCKDQEQNLMPVLELDEITVGVLEKNMADSCRAMIRTVRPEAEWMDSNVSYVFKEVPIVIWRVKGVPKVFEHPDHIFFYTEDFFIPNPFRAYWNSRDKVMY